MYRINEGTIDLPESWQDRSINVISSSLTGPGATMTITRDDVPWGMAFGEYVDDQAKQAAQALKNFETLGRRDLVVDKSAAIEIECRWVAAQGKVHQLITTVQDEAKVLVLTASIGGEMSEGQKAEMRRIAQTLRLDRKRG